MSGLKNMSGNGLQNRKGFVLLPLQAGKILPKSNQDISIAADKAVPCDGSHFGGSDRLANLKGGCLFWYVHKTNSFVMQAGKNLDISAQGASISTQTERNTIPIHQFSDLINALIEACRLLPNKMELQVQFIVNNTVMTGDYNTNVSGDNNSNLANIYRNE